MDTLRIATFAIAVFGFGAAMYSLACLHRLRRKLAREEQDRFDARERAVDDLAKRAGLR